MRLNEVLGSVCLHMRGIPCALGCGAYLSVWWEVGALYVEHLVVSTDSVRATKLFTYVIDNNDYQ